jgi:hypothetical protein
VLAERRTRYPLVDLSLFKSGTFVMACVAAFLFSATVFGSQPYTSLFMQNYWGFTPLEGGLAFLPATVLVAALMPLSGIMGQRLGHQLRLVVMAGSILVAVSFFYLLQLDVGDGYVGGFLPAFVLRGAGIGLFMSSSSLAVVSAVPLAKSGLASGTLTMSRNIGTSLGSRSSAPCTCTTSTRRRPRASPRRRDAGGGLSGAADRFVPAGDGAIHAAASQLIVDGYVLVALVCVVVALVATAASFFIRQGAPAPRAAVERVPAVVPAATTSGGPGAD